jgi:hypothetical protein
MMPKTLRTLALGATALACASSASAFEKVGYGWDLLATVPSTKIYGIDLIGVPIGSYDFGTNSYGQFIGVQATGNADTIVRRLEEAMVFKPIPPSKSDTISIEMVALQLRTATQVDLGWGLDYYYFTQSIFTLSTGVMTITFNREITILDTDPYGTFTSQLDVFVNVRKGCLTCPILTDEQLKPIEIHKKFDAMAEWYHWLDNPNLVEIPGVNVFLNNQDRNWDFWFVKAFHFTPDHDTHTVVPATIPEPGTWAMLIAGFGLVGFAARRRREAVVA